MAEYYAVNYRCGRSWCVAALSIVLVRSSMQTARNATERNAAVQVFEKNRKRNEL